MAHIFNADMECNSLAEFKSKAEANGTVAASNEQAMTGTYSLKANITNAGGTAFVAQEMEDTQSELYYRFYCYLPTATYNELDIANDGVFILGGLTTAAALIFYLTFINVAGTVKLRLHRNATAASTDFTCPSRDAWHCIELYFKCDGANGAWEVWVDGVSQGSATGENTGAVTIGLNRWGPAVSVGMTGAIYEDNMVVATTRIYPLMGNIPGTNALRNRKESPQGWVI